MKPSDPLEPVLKKAAAFLLQNLAVNLHSLVLYGSAVGGEYVEGRSDINLLVVLEASTPESHEFLRELCTAHPMIHPFVVERSGLPRAAQVFGLKFLSIQRSHRVLHGTDALKDFQLGASLQVLLAEQECRNLRMRLTHAYSTSGRKLRAYEEFLTANTPRFFIVLSDVARCGEIDLPPAMGERAPVFARTFGSQTAALEFLWHCHQHNKSPGGRRTVELHRGLISMFSGALKWMEQKWPTLPM
jgi:predicted nucleotidyltransferase